MLSKIKDTKGKFNKLSIDINFFDFLDFGFSSLDDSLAVVDEVYAFTAIENEKINILNIIKDTTNDVELRKACESIIKKKTDVHKNAILYYLNNFGKETAVNILDVGADILGKLVLDGSSYVGAADVVDAYNTGKVILTAGRMASDLVMNATNISKTSLSVAAYHNIETALKDAIDVIEDDFTNDKTYNNAVMYLTSADILKSSLLYSCDLYIKYIEEAKRGDTGIEIASILTTGPIGILTSMFGKDVDYDGKIEQCQNIKENIKKPEFYKQRKCRYSCIHQLYKV